MSSHRWTSSLRRWWRTMQIMVLRWRRRVHTSRTLLRALSRSTAMMCLRIAVLELAMQPKTVIRLLSLCNLVDFIFLVFWIGCWEGWVDVLWDEVVFLAATCFHAGDVCFLEWPVLVESTADEVRGVWKIWGSRANADLATWLHATRLLSSFGAIKGRHVRERVDRRFRWCTMSTHAWTECIGLA